MGLPDIVTFEVRCRQCRDRGASLPDLLGYVVAQTYRGLQALGWIRHQRLGADLHKAVGRGPRSLPIDMSDTIPEEGVRGKCRHGHLCPPDGGYVTEDQMLAKIVAAGYASGKGLQTKLTAPATLPGGRCIYL